jgi:hypothetical protein
MSAFPFTQLEEGEVMVIGPVTFSSSSSFSVSGPTGQSAQIGRTKQRVMGITNRRVIVEQSDQPNATQIVANADVKRVHVKRDKFGTKIEKVETNRGQTLELNLGGLNPMQEARLFEIFSNAEIGEKKGLFGGFSKLGPRPMPVMRRSTSTPPKPQAKKGARAAAARPATVKPVAAATGKSIISDADIHSLDDLRRYYPLPKEYAYAEAAAGQFVVKRVSDGAQFPILCEEEMLGFDVPVQDPKRKKITVEVIKKK